jgi:hypothetical protein
MATAGILKFPSLKTIYTHAIQHFYLNFIQFRSLWQLLGGLKKYKMAAVAMVTKVQNGRQIQKSSDLGRNLVSK